MTLKKGQRVKVYFEFSEIQSALKRWRNIPFSYDASKFRIQWHNFKWDLIDVKQCRKLVRKK